MGGLSTGNLTREKFAERWCNVLRGHVSLANNGGFVQMATNLTPESRDNGAAVSVDASEYTGVEVDVYSKSENAVEQYNIQ
jgi:Complex I intermediate-associated protein 30 (CIA30)